MSPAHCRDLPAVDAELLARAITLAERANCTKDEAAAAALREEAFRLWGEAHAARRDAMYARGCCS